MSEFLTPTIILILLFSTIRSATPLIFAALGGMFSERAGVINIALEGLMLAGAFTAAVATYELQNPYLGFFSAMVVGALVAPVNGSRWPRSWLWKWPTTISAAGGSATARRFATGDPTKLQPNARWTR